MTNPENGPGPAADFHEEALPHMDAVFRFALRLSGSRDQAEDLVQETFLRAFRSWEKYTPGTQCKSWLFTICRNVFLRHRERGQRHDEIVSENVDRSSGPFEVVNPVWVKAVKADPEGDFFDSIVDEVVLGHIQDLPEDYKTAVILSDLEGLSYQEIAATLDCSEETARAHVYQAMGKIRRGLAVARK